MIRNRATDGGLPGVVQDKDCAQRESLALAVEPPPTADANEK
jgi:hypothetical protein